MRLTKKRLLVAASGVTALGAAATLVAGVTFGLFSATTPGINNTFTAGTVTLDQTASTTCTIGATNQTPNVTLTAGSTTASIPSGSFPSVTGWSVSGTGIRSGTTVANEAGASLVLSKAATSGGIVTLTFTSPTPPLSPGDGNGTVNGTAYNDQTGTYPSCSLTFNYQSTVPMWLALDVIVNGTPGSPVQSYGPDNSGTTPDAAPGLFDGSGNGLQVAITDSHFSDSFISGGVDYNDTSGTATDLTGSCTGNGTETGCAASSGTGSSDLLFSATPVTATTAVSDTVTVAYGLPSDANNAYQGAATTITLVVHAVQADNNSPATSDCGSATDACPSIQWTS